jgi:putative hydrolase of the HAD superfamily
MQNYELSDNIQQKIKKNLSSLGIFQNLQFIKAKNMSVSTNNYDNIIFDLGGVIIDIEPEKIREGLADRHLRQLESAMPKLHKNRTFEDFETGRLSPDKFRESIRKAFREDLPDRHIDAAWNLLLLNFPGENIAVLKALQKTHRLFLLSNTNIIHYQAYAPQLVTEHGLSFKDIFEKEYYSFDLGMRKPDTKIFEHVLEDSRLKPEKTLFVDDTKENIEAAESLGIKGVHIERNSGLKKLFNV